MEALSRVLSIRDQGHGGKSTICEGDDLGPSFRPKSGSKSKFSDRILQSFRGPFSSADAWPYGCLRNDTSPDPAPRPRAPDLGGCRRPGNGE